MPKSDVAGTAPRAGRRSVKYEKSSVDLASRLGQSFMHSEGGSQGQTHACAPSLRAMNGRSDHSFSTAGSVPSGAPNQLSTSGPLGRMDSQRGARQPRSIGRAYRAWWKPTTVTSGAKPLPLSIALLDAPIRRGTPIGVSEVVGV
jgi:hypothetical protein